MKNKIPPSGQVLPGHCGTSFPAGSGRAPETGCGSRLRDTPFWVQGMGRDRKESKMARLDVTRDMYCTALQLKEKKRELYAQAMKTCPDQVGVATFKMLLDAETEHMEIIRKAYEEAKAGRAGGEVCGLSAIDAAGKKSLLRKIASEKQKVSRACFDDVAAIEAGMRMEDASISFFTGTLDRAADADERRFLERLIEEEREHYRLLADLKFYYVDPEHWFMETSSTGLDGAGAFS